MRQRAAADRLARLGPFALLGCLLALAVLLGGTPSRADEPKKDDTKKEDKKEDKLPPGFPTFEEWIKRLPMKPSEEQLKQLRKMYDLMLEQAKKAPPGSTPPVFPPVLPPGPGGFPGVGPTFMPFPGGMPEMRLGARIEPVSPVLTEHLDLPEGEGIVLLDVRKDSAAAKAGIKSRDILLELNGKKVPSDLRRFLAMLGDVKEDAEVDAVVLHKGKKETIKGLKLPKGNTLTPLIPGTVPPPPGLVPPAKPPAPVPNPIKDK
jgi:membrane-associated protease RseP (regulator of RpoE activity)